MTPPLKVGVLTTHPIQYQVPWFRILNNEPSVDLHVFFAMIPDAAAQGDGFGVAFEWDLPLLEGYCWTCLSNVAAEPSVTRFFGCDTPEIHEIVRDGDWDVFLVNGWVAKCCIQALVACRLSGVPCMVRGEVNGLRPRPWWKLLGHRLLLSQYRAALAIGRHNREYLLKRGVPPDRVFSTPYGVENERFPLQRREEQGTAERPVRFLFCGKLEPKKRPLDVFLAASQLAEESGLPPFEVVIAGDGALRSELERFSERAGLRIHFRGFVNQSALPAVYAECDCLVLPSDAGETWGLVVNEAMATGLPAIVSDAIGSANDLVLDGETGWVFPLGDVERLAGAMRAALTDLPELRTRGDRGARRVRSLHGPEHVAAGVLEALRAVARISNAQVSEP